MNRTHPFSSHLLVGLQLVCMGLAIYPFDPARQTLAWLVVSLLGGLVGMYTLWHNRPGNFGIYPELVDRAQLITSGPYRWVRHPMYLALLLFAAGFALYNGSLWNLLGVVCLMPVLIGKISREEACLRQQFTDYAAYSGATRRLIPYLY